jgi:hypothetical protein
VSLDSLQFTVHLLIISRKMRTPLPAAPPHQALPLPAAPPHQALPLPAAPPHQALRFNQVTSVQFVQGTVLRLLLILNHIYISLSLYKHEYTIHTHVHRYFLTVVD